jgi:hypothetical protein
VNHQAFIGSRHFHLTLGVSAMETLLASRSFESILQNLDFAAVWS